MRIFIYTKLSFLLLLGSLFGQPGSLYKVKRSLNNQAQKNGETNHITFAILENNNKKYEIHSNVAYDVPFPNLTVFNNGNSVLIDAFNARLTFYNDSGIENSQVSIMKDPDIEYERSVYNTINGQSLVIALDQPGLDYILIQLYNHEGQFIRELKINEKHINGLEYSEALELIALSVYDWSQNVLKKKIMFINSRGKYTIQSDLNFSNGDFAEEKGIFSGYSNNNCFIFDLAAKTMLFSKRTQEGKMILLAQFINDQFSVIETRHPVLQKGQWYFQAPSISLYSMAGHLIRKSLMDSKPFTEYHLHKKDSQWIFETENETIPFKD